MTILASKPTDKCGEAITLADICRKSAILQLQNPGYGRRPLRTGIVLETPQDENRAKYCLAHRRAGEPGQADYTILPPSKRGSIEKSNGCCVIYVPSGYVREGTPYSDEESAAIIELLEQHHL